MLRRYISYCYLLVLGTFSICAQSFTGRIIQDDPYQTPLFGATIWHAELGRGVITGLAGYFTFDNLSPGSHVLRVSFVGFVPREITITVPSVGIEVIALSPDVTLLDAITVEGRAQPSMLMEQAPLGSIRVTDLPLILVPRLMGEPDLIRMVQNLPGVKTESDFTGGFHVRGGRNDQNLILLDGVPVYNPWHLFGLFSAFNTEAIDRVDLTKGVMPARYGSRLSSVLDIELQKGDTRLGAGYLTVSPLSSSFSYGRPINQKTSLLFSMRRTYMDPIFWASNAILSGPKQVNAGGGSTVTEFHKVRNGYAFSDFNLKFVHKLTPVHRLEAAVFRSRDELDIFARIRRPQYQNETSQDELRFGWRNATGSLAWITQKPNFSQRTQAFTSFYRAENAFNTSRLGQSSGNSISVNTGFTYAVTDEFERQLFQQQFQDIGLQHDATWYVGNKLAVHAGAQWLYHRFRELSTVDNEQFGFYYLWGQPLPPEPRTIEKYLDKKEGDTLINRPHELSAYAGLSWSWGKLTLHPGVRIHHYTLGQYTYALPRINAIYDVSEKIKVSAGYGHTSQYLQTVGLELVRIPAERWFWADDTRTPALSKMATIGVGYTTATWGSISVEAYYKTMTGLLNFSPLRQAEAINESLIPRFGAESVSGTGEAYGVEGLWQKTEGKITGWLGYTLSWAWNQFDELNNAARFPMRTDKRHDIQTFWNWQFNENWSLGLLFNYKTGQPVTFSAGRYLPTPDILEIGDENYSDKVVFQMNNYRLPDYHRLDLNLTWHNRRFMKRKTEWSLNVINVYNRLNVLTVTNTSDYRVLPNGRLRVIPDNKLFGQMPIIPVINARIALGGDAK